MKRAILVIAGAALCAAPAAAAPPSLSLKAAPTQLVYGAASTMSGVLSTGKAGETVDIQAQACGQGAFKKVATATTTTGGGFSASVKPTMNTVYQAREKGSTSPTVTVKVAPLVVLKKLAVGKFSVSVTAAQSYTGKYVVFQRLRRLKWVTLKKVTLKTVVTTTAPTQVSSATFRIKLPTKLRVRAILPLPQAGSCYLAGRSKAIRS